MGTTVNTKYSLYKYGPGFDGNECIAFQLPSRNRCKIEAKKAGLKEGEYFIHEQEYYTTNRGTYIKGEQNESEKTNPTESGESSKYEAENEEAEKV